MDPFSWIILAITLAGAATSFVGAQQSADAAEDAGKAQQEAAAQKAHNEELQTAENVKRERINKRRRLARLRTTTGASGLVMEGSLMDSFAETAGTLELGIEDARRAGSMEAANTRSEGEMALWEARNAAIGTRISSYGTLLSSASNIGGYATSQAAA